MIDWIHSLTEKDRESFLAFCKRAGTPIQIYLYARFLGFTGSIVECDSGLSRSTRSGIFLAF